MGCPQFDGLACTKSGCRKKLGCCKGNLAVLRKSLKLARDDPKRIYNNNIYNQGLDTTDLARNDPKRIL
jgi:hypothetical protein